MSGLTWTTTNSGISPYEPPVTNGSLWFVHDGNTSYATSADDGATWTARTFVTDRRIGVLVAVGTRVFSLGSDTSYGPNAIYYTDNGTSWTELVPTPDYTNGIGGIASDGDDLYVKLSDVGYTETWYRVDPVAFTWTAIAPPGSAELVGGNGVLFSTSYDGTLHRSADGGGSWTEVIAAYALSSNTITPMFAQDGVWVASNSTNDSPVFLRSTNNGVTWASVVPTGAFTPTVNAFNSFTASGLTGTIVVSAVDNDPGVWYSQGGGDSWLKDDNIGLEGLDTVYIAGTPSLLMVVSDEDATGNVYTTASAAVVSTQNIEDSPATVSDEVVQGQAAFTVETASASDEISHYSFTTVVETASAADALQETVQQFVVETATASDAAATVSSQLVDESAFADDAVQASTSHTLTETSSADDAATSTSVTGSLVVDTATASDAVLLGGIDMVVESATAADEVSDAAAQLVEEVAAASDAVQDGAVGTVTFVEELTAASDEVVSLGGVGYQYVEELATATDAYLHKDPTAVAWVLNTETGGACWYSNWQFSHMTQVGNRVFAVGPEGLVELGADTDNGESIDATVQYGFQDFGVDQKKRVDAFWFGYNSADVLEATVETYGQGHPVYTYTMVRREADSPRNNRIQPGKGLNARYWRIGVNNVGGCDFSVDSIGADVAVTSRRL